MNLECGTSLAELEYSSDYHQKQWKAEEKINQVSPLSAESSSSSSLEGNLRSLRSHLANDIVTNGDIPFFTSPYETPKAHSASGQTGIPEKERYVSVPLVYCDQTASNRPLKSVESYIQNICLPLYGNTHTNTSVTGSQSTAFVAEARQIVAEVCNAKITGKAALDVVLFAGNGATSVVELLIDCLGLKYYSSDEANTRPVVFVGPYEHHSNLLPWRESGCEIVMIPECQSAQNVDISYLEQMLQSPLYRGNRLKMGAFTAASNVTGKVVDVDAIAATLHKYGALAFFDYATGAPYLPINMNPFPHDKYKAADVAKDAICISPHKMIGGVQTPGVLIIKKHLINQTIPPKRSGGGTVFYVTHKHHRFLSNRIERYEGGTPNVVGIFRAGLAFLVKRSIESQYLRAIGGRMDHDKASIPPSLIEYEFQTHRHVVQRLKQSAPNIIVLGSADDSVSNNHLPIFSFLIKCGDRFLHYNYVCAILNDLFGIQSRGGCQCAGPYSQRLLGLTCFKEGEEVPNEINERFEHALLHYKERAELLRPGFTRISLPFKGLHHEEVEYVIKSLEWIAQYGWVFMCQYRCNHRTGEWRHFCRQGKPLGRTERRWLSHYNINYEVNISNGGEVQNSLAEVLDSAMQNANYQLEIARSDQTISQALKMTDENAILDANSDLDLLRWFVYPRECAVLLTRGEKHFPETYTDKINGGIRPLGFFQQAQYNFSLPLVDLKTAQVLPSAEHSDQRRIEIDASSVVQFRDGEDHCGEALISDIISGYDDGELTDGCLVFIEKEDTWETIKSVIDRIKLSSSYETQKESVHSTSEPRNQPEKLSFVEKKKPSRTSSSWGKSSVSDLPKVEISPAVPYVGPSEVIRNTNESDISKKNKKTKHIKPPAKLMRYITQAIMQWDMIQEGDRLLLGLSGGKDSLTLLHCLLEFQRKLPVKFEIEVCTIDPLTPSFDPSPLIPYVESLGLKYHYIRDNIIERANTAGTNGQIVKSLCSFCARMKRGNLYATARRNNCNKLVLAQHLDDCAESFLMSALHNGFIRTMKANYRINAGDLSVIRPMVYCRESLMTDFAKTNNLPIINENCPACFEEPKERARIKKLLSREETLYPNIHDKIRRAIIPIMHDDMTAILKSYTEEALSKSRKEQGPGKSKKRKHEAESDATQSPPVIATDAKEIKRSDESLSLDLARASEDDLLRELAKRRAARYKTYGAMKTDERVREGNDIDMTGQVCTMDGENGTIRCYELME